MMVRWSHSRLSCYASCPRRYAFRYEEGREEPTTDAALRGSQVHEFLELYGQHCHKTGQERDWDEGRRLAASYSDEAREICLGALEQVKFDWHRIVADKKSIERTFEVELPGDRGLFRGRIDLVERLPGEDVIIVTDYKSGWGGYRPDECPQQPVCYAWAMTQQRGFEQVKQVIARIHYVGNAKVHQWELWTPKPDWACSLVDRIEADDEYRATPGDHCAYCGFTSECPLVLADAVTHIEDEEDAREALRQVLATRARADAINKPLRDWVKEHGAAIADGYRAANLPPKNADELSYIPGKGTSLHELVNALVDAGLSEDDLLPMVDPKKLTALVVGLQGEDDPFGSDGQDPRLTALLGFLEERLWDGRTRYRIERMPDAETVAAE